MLERILVLDPSRRISAKLALTNKYFNTPPLAPLNASDLQPITLPGTYFHEFKAKQQRRNKDQTVKSNSNAHFSPSLADTSQKVNPLTQQLPWYPGYLNQTLAQPPTQTSLPPQIPSHTNPIHIQPHAQLPPFPPAMHRLPTSLSNYAHLGGGYGSKDLQQSHYQYNMHQQTMQSQQRQKGNANGIAGQHSSRRFNEQ